MRKFFPSLFEWFSWCSGPFRRRHRHPCLTPAYEGLLYLYTTELGTTPPPELSTSRLLYIRFRQNRLKYYMIKRTKVHHWLCRKMVLHGKQEYCTSQNKGILYITEIRNIVHHRKQEYCTSLKSGILYITEKKEFCTTQKSGILYITQMMRSVNGTCVTVDASKYGVWWYQIPFICSIQSRKRWDTVQNKFVEFMCWMIKLLDGDGGVLKRPQYIRLCCNNARGYSTSDYAATTQGPFTLLIRVTTNWGFKRLLPKHDKLPCFYIFPQDDILL